MTSRRLAAIGLIGAMTVFGQGCLNSSTLIKVRPDGTGTIEQTLLANPKSFESLAVMAEQMGGGEGKKGTSGLPSPKDLLDEAKLKEGGKVVHAPFKDGDCLSCHKPHAAPKPSLLAEAPRAVCLGCHDAADAGLRKAHLGAKLDGLDCTSCHTPHGAGQAKALARHVHAPVAEGCDTCHQGTSSKLVENGNPPLCLSCHEEIGQAAKAAKVAHAAMDAARCVDCHNPHASAQQRLVKRPGGADCLACHSDQAPGADEHGHGAISLVGCQACHEPHGGARPRLLRSVGNGLCLGCHRTPALRLPSEGIVSLAGRFEVAAAAAQAIHTLILSPDGTRGHPNPGHLVVVQGAPADPKLPGKVDLVLMVGVYHHVDQRTAYFRKLAGSLKPGGAVAIVDFTKESPVGPPPASRIAASEVKAEMKAAGYALAAEHAFLPNQYFLLFKPR